MRQELIDTATTTTIMFLCIDQAKKKRTRQSPQSVAQQTIINNTLNLVLIIWNNVRGSAKRAGRRPTKTTKFPTTMWHRVKWNCMSHFPSIHPCNHLSHHFIHEGSVVAYKNIECLVTSTLTFTSNICLCVYDISNNI